MSKRQNKWGPSVQKDPSAAIDMVASIAAGLSIRLQGQNNVVAPLMIPPPVLPIPIIQQPLTTEFYINDSPVRKNSF